MTESSNQRETREQVQHDYETGRQHAKAAAKRETPPAPPIAAAPIPAAPTAAAPIPAAPIETSQPVRSLPPQPRSLPPPLSPRRRPGIHVISEGALGILCILATITTVLACVTAGDSRESADQIVAGTIAAGGGVAVMLGILGTVLCQIRDGIDWANRREELKTWRDPAEVVQDRAAEPPAGPQPIGRPGAWSGSPPVRRPLR